jgi:hypothetical protein
VSGDNCPDGLIPVDPNSKKYPADEPGFWIGLVIITTDYNEGAYTKVGIEWVNDTDMSTVLLRHYPALAPALRGVANAFWPWTKVGRE